MADQRQLEILKKGPQAWNEWREQNGQLRTRRPAPATKLNFRCEATRLQQLKGYYPGFEFRRPEKTSTV